MKKYIQSTTIKSLITATAVLGFVAVPFIQAQDGQTVIKTERTPLGVEVTKTFVDGYQVPSEYRTYFTDFPTIEEKDVVVRYQNGRAYYVNSNDWKIVRVVELDSSVKLAKEDSVFVEGYVIPEDRRTNFIEVPNPEEETSVRYYNNTAYYMNSDYEIVRTVKLSR